MTTQTLSNDLVRKFGFSYAHNGKTNILICLDCEKLYRDLQDRLEGQAKQEICSFFDNCGKDKTNGNKGKPKNG